MSVRADARACVCVTRGELCVTLVPGDCQIQHTHTHTCVKASLDLDESVG